MQKGELLLENNKPMLNAYPDSIGGTLKEMANFLKKPELQGIFSCFYILPSLFHTDLDRGFSVIDYELNKLVADEATISEIKELGIELKLDFILNHASVLSEPFQDIIRNGQRSKYRDYFVHWNRFWEGHGEKNADGVILPEESLIKDMFFRKPGLPILLVRMPDGSKEPYWNTFYQEIKYPCLDAQDIRKIANLQYQEALELALMVNQRIKEGAKPAEIEFGRYQKYQEAIRNLLEQDQKYLGQMDLNIESPLVWEFYEATIKKLAEYGATIIRLDAFAYAPKKPGARNFLNEPETWEILDKLRKIADLYQISLLPEIHAGYEEQIYRNISDKGYLTYDFFLPGLILDALEEQEGGTLVSWAEELKANQIYVINMLGCHDGIPLLDLKGLIPEERIQNLIATVVERGGYVKNLHGQKHVYYQVNATYYSALGEMDSKMLIARAIQLFMPGKPQVWYLDLLVGKNDYEAVARYGENGHKEMNRTNLTKQQVEEQLEQEVVKKQISMLRFRSSFPAFSIDADFIVEGQGELLRFCWEKQGYKATLQVDLKQLVFEVLGFEEGEKCVYKMS